MKKGLITALSVVSLTLTGSAFAVAPTILDLPDIVIGDAEDNHGTDNNNFFVCTGAFELNKKVVDPDTAFSALKWSFSEFDALDGSEDATPTQWFTVNGKDPVKVGYAAIMAAGADADHLDPGAKELSAAGATANFRDIVMSPGSGPLTSAFAEKPAAVKATHAAGKKVAFYVSDGFNVASKECFVQTIDESMDSASGGASWEQKDRDTFDSDPSSTGWAKTEQTLATLGACGYDAVADGITARVNSFIPTGTNPNKFRSWGWRTSEAEWLPYADVSTDKYVRAKYYMYATGVTVPAGRTQGNTTPNIRIRLANRFAVTSMLEILHNGDGDYAAQPFANEFAPSTNPLKPSLYRVDFDPIDVPQLVNNATMNKAATPITGEGIQRMFEAYTINPNDNGTIVLTESVIGTYAAAELDDSRALAPAKVWAPGTADAGALSGNAAIAPGSAVIKDALVMGTAEGDFASRGTFAASMIHTENTSGITLDTRSCPDYPSLGVLVREFTANPGYTTANHTSRIRVEPNKQYKVKWHLTSTQQSNINAQIRLRARSVKFQWTQKYEIGGAWAILGANQRIAEQALPGVGCQNPDKMAGETNGGWYTMIVQSPINADIRADVAGTIEQKYPRLMTQPGPGVDVAAGAPDSMRDLKLGLDVVDSISWNDTKEKGLFSLDRIEVRAYDLVDDGGYAY